MQRSLGLTPRCAVRWAAATRRERLERSRKHEHFRGIAGAGLRLAVLALDAEQVLEFAGLGGLKDPMDRLVVVAARATSSPVVSADDALDGFGVRRVWD